MSGYNEFAQLAQSTAAASSRMSARSEQLTSEGFTGRTSGGAFFSHYFPTNYNEIYHFVTFKVLKFESVTRTSALQTDQVLTGNRKSQIERLLGTITLPLPNKLDTSYNANYPDSDKLSATGEVLATGISNVNLQSVLAAGGGEGGQTAAVLRQSRELAQQSTGGGGPLAAAVGTDILGKITGRLGDGGAAAAANITGVARNPHKVLLFSGVDFRTHSFSFSLVPKNKREADTIQKIITAFKRHMLPKYGLGNLPNLINQGGNLFGLSQESISAFTTNASQVGASSRAFFEYPDVFIIEFNNMKKLFSVGESVMTGFNVDYHPQNYPAYVRSLSSPGEADPAAITISMSFKETDIVTRDHVDQFGR